MFGDEQSFDDGQESADATAEVAQPQVQYRPQGFNIYSMMLLLSFLFLTAASIIFFNYSG
jgi:hypothetical protein